MRNRRSQQAPVTGGDERPRPLSLLETQILTVLAAGGARHGYGIARALRACGPGEPRVLPTNLYRRLHELVARGLLADAGVEVDSSGRARKNFAITDAGRAALAREAARLARIVDDLRACDLPSPEPRSQ